MGGVDFSTWIPGWSALAAVLLYGALLLKQATDVRRARESFATRVLITGSRGKSGTVRLIHAGLCRSGRSAYGKITGTRAVELLPDGTEKATVRFGSAGISELAQSMLRAEKARADFGIFECMAISPERIHAVQAKYVKARIVVIPTIRLDHLEDEGVTESEIGMNIFRAVDDCDYLVTGIDQPDLQTAYRQWCEAKGIEFILAKPGPDTPRILGHHPTNVEVARQVLLLLGLSDEQACAGMRTASTEPNVLNFRSIPNPGGIALGLADIGAANDPQSAYEAMAQWPLEGEVVVPVVANRWDRPLRAVVFAGALIGRYAVVGVSGTLFRWIENLAPATLSPERRDYVSTEFFELTRRLATDPELLERTLIALLGKPDQGRFVLMIMANTHDRHTDLLRKTFADRGVQLQLDYAD